MPTLKQIAANRRNAKESTGPKTEAGKATASRNTFRHGILALAEGCLPWESPGELAELHRQMMEDWHPRGFTELAIVESMVADMWRMRRLQRTELGVELNNTLAIASRRMEEERQQGYRYERITWGPAAFAEPPAAQAASEAHPEDVYVYRATVEDFGQASNLYFSLWSTLYCKAKECCQSRPDPCLVAGCRPAGCPCGRAAAIQREPLQSSGSLLDLASQGQVSSACLEPLQFVHCLTKGVLEGSPIAAQRGERIGTCNVAKWVST
jgi:hypothetical protein